MVAVVSAPAHLPTLTLSIVHRGLSGQGLRYSFTPTWIGTWTFSGRTSSSQVSCHIALVPLASPSLLGLVLPGSSWLRGCLCLPAPGR